MKKTALKNKTRLKSHGVKLKKSSLNKVSNKQRSKNTLWGKIKKQRIRLLIKKYGFLPDEFTGEDITNEAIIDAHHNENRKSDNYTLENCRILKRFNHTYVTDHNIKEVKDWLN